MRRKLTKKQKDMLKHELQYRVDSMMADLLTEYESVRIFWELVKVQRELKKVK